MTETVSSAGYEMPTPGSSGPLGRAALVLMTVPVLWTALAWTESLGAGLSSQPLQVLLPAALASGLLALVALLTALRRRGAGLLLAGAWVAWGKVLLIQAPATPALAFVCGAWAATLTYLILVPGDPGRSRLAAPTHLGALLSPAVLMAGTLGLLLSGLAAGHHLHQTTIGRWSVLALVAVPALMATTAEWALVRAGCLEAWKALLLSGATAAGLASVSLPGIAFALLAIRLLLAVLGAARSHALYFEVASFLWKRPAILVVVTFALLALTGGIVLKFPACATRPISAVDALFTAVSACCVTGLVVLDTPVDFTLAGQAAILLLIQVGGLGIMTLSAFATLLVGGALPSQEEQGLADVVGASTPGRTVRLVRSIVRSTLVIEGAGALLLLPAFLLEGLPFLDALWRSIFHAISAFCNAGFALQSDNLVSYQRHPWVLHVIGALIVLGGLGFGVISGAVELLLRRGGRMTLHGRLVLVTTAVLLVGGALLFLLLETPVTLSGLSWTDRLHNAWFQSITSRTAGFNSIDFSRITPAAVLAITILMFIGASPASTGGGIKTSTAAVLFLAVRGVLRQSPDVQAFGRRIPVSAVFRAAAVTAASSAFVVAGLLILLATQELPLQALLFESVSAFGTVGLSLGITPALDPLGKLVIMGLMLAGRTGPLTLMLLFHGQSESRIRYPEEEVLIG